MPGFAVRRSALLAAALACGVLLALSACAPRSAPEPLPTPHYTIVPVPRPGQLRIEGSGASICSTNSASRDVVLGFGVDNDDSAPLTLTGVSFTIEYGGRVAGTWTVEPPSDLRADGTIVTSSFDYPPAISTWSKRASLDGTTLQPGASTYLLLRFVRDPGNSAALFLDPAIHYTKLGRKFTASTTNSGFEYQPKGHCAFSND
jgi:hypothetical protein